MLQSDEAAEVRIGREWEPRPDPGDFGFDVRGAPLLGDGDAVVPIDHEVRVVHLIDDDRWEPALRERLLHSLPPVGELRPPGEQLTVEVASAVDGPHDVVDGDVLDAHIRLLKEA